MADLWYYTSEGKQMEPVTASDLKQLAATGLLKPTDMVWKEGMPKWIRASSAQGLFDDAGAAATASDVGAKRAPAKASQRLASAELDKAMDERPRRERRRNPDREDDDDTEDDDRPRRRRRAQEEGMSTGVKVGLILGASVLLIGLIVGAIILLANAGGEQPIANVNPPINVNVPPVINNNPPVNNGGGKQLATFSMNLLGNAKQFRSQFFKANTRYELNAKSDHADRDFDFAIVDNKKEKNDLKFAANRGRDADIVFNPTTSGNYNVEVHNLSGQPNRVNVTIREIGPEIAQANPVPPINPPIFNPAINPAILPGPRAPVFKGPLTIGPGGYVEANRIAINDSREASWLCKVYTIQMFAGKTYTIRNESRMFDAYLVLQNSNHGILMQNDDSHGSLDSEIVFSPQQTGVYRVVVTSLGGGSVGNYTFRVTER